MRSVTHAARERLATRSQIRCRVAVANAMRAEGSLLPALCKADGESGLSSAMDRPLGVAELNFEADGEADAVHAMQCFLSSLYSNGGGDEPAGSNIDVSAADADIVIGKLGRGPCSEAALLEALHQPVATVLQRWRAAAKAEAADTLSSVKFEALKPS